MKKRIIAAGSVIVVSLVSGLVLTNLPKQEQAMIQKQAQVEVIQEQDKPVEAPVQALEQEEVKVPVQNTHTPTEPSVEPTPTVLSTQEYANQYLDLSNPRAQQCLDAIVATWPARFAENVREQNIKALRAWTNVCTTGMDTPNKTIALIYQYGANGEYFDTELAKSKQ